MCFFLFFFLFTCPLCWVCLEGNQKEIIKRHTCVAQSGTNKDVNSLGMFSLSFLVKRFQDAPKSTPSSGTLDGVHLDDIFKNVVAATGHWEVSDNLG